MNVETVKFTTLDAWTQLYVANQVSDFTNGRSNEQPQMLPVAPEDIISRHCGVVAMSESTFCGYIGAEPPDFYNGDNMSEVGTLWVPDDFRRQNIAGRLVEAATEEVVSEGSVPYAFCNSLSLPVFIRSGYDPVEAEEIPAAAFNACKDCPAKPMSGCCDTVAIYKRDSKL